MLAKRLIIFTDIPESRSLHLDTTDPDGDKTDETQVGVHNRTAEISAPYFVRPEQVHRVVAKPAGSMLRLKCSSEGNPTPNITWYKNNEEPTRTLGTFRIKGWSLTIEDVVPQDGGNYTCIVCNVHGCINHTFKVDIIGEHSRKVFFFFFFFDQGVDFGFGYLIIHLDRI